MEIKVKYLSIFRNITGKADEIIQLDQQVATVHNLIHSLTRMYGIKIGNMLLNPKKTLQVTVLINGKATANLEAKLNQGDVVMFVPPLGGGSHYPSARD